MSFISETFDLFARFGGEKYGEDISIETHMLQSAAFAERLDLPDHLIVAALLHDVGHFLDHDAERAAKEGRDIQHEAIGAAWLSRAFNEEVTVPIALHVRAKRYLCAAEPEYYNQLSQASRLSLAAQGGIMNADEVAAFTREPCFESAVLLRRCDDRGKDVTMTTQTVEQYRPLLMAHLH